MKSVILDINFLLSNVRMSNNGVDDVGDGVVVGEDDEGGWEGGQDVGMVSLRRMPRTFSEDIRDMNQVKCRVIIFLFFIDLGHPN